MGYLSIKILTIFFQNSKIFAWSEKSKSNNLQNLHFLDLPVKMSMKGQAPSNFISEFDVFQFSSSRQVNFA